MKFLSPEILLMKDKLYLVGFKYSKQVYTKTFRIKITFLSRK